MLGDNTAALESALSLPAETLREKISSAYLYGAEATLGSVLGGRCRAVVGALPNADTDGAPATLALLNPHGLIAGLLAVKRACGAPEALLVLPREDGFAPLLQAAAQADIPVEARDFLDVRAHKDDLLLHWATLAAVSDILAGNPPEIPAAVGGRLVEIAPGKAIGSNLPAENLKAVRIGSTFYTPAVLGEPARPGLFATGSAIEPVSNDACIVQAAFEQVMKLRQKCCGKCVLCREGLFQFGEIFRGVTEAKSALSELALAGEIGAALIDAAVCSVGKAASSCMLSVLEGFGEELKSHIQGKKCPSGRCQAFARYYVNPMKCRACGVCIEACPENCIEGAPGYISMIDDAACTKCGKCAEVCPEGAIARTQNRIPNLPRRLTKVGRFRR